MSEIVIPKHLDIPEVNNYLKRVGQELIETDYQETACGLVALDIAWLLHRHGTNPRIDELTSTSKDKLSPLIFKGRVQWLWHTICAVENIVFDPLVQRPLPFAQYQKELFDPLINPIVRRTEFDPRGLKHFLQIIWATE